MMAPTKGLLIPWLQVQVLRGSLTCPVLVKVLGRGGRRSWRGSAAYFLLFVGLVLREQDDGVLLVNPISEGFAADLSDSLAGSGGLHLAFAVKFVCEHNPK